MRFNFSKWNLRSACVCCLVLTTQVSLSSSQLFAQEKTTEPKEIQVPGKDVTDKPKEDAKQDETDPFAIPEAASVAELFAVINTVKEIVVVQTRGMSALQVLKYPGPNEPKDACMLLGWKSPVKEVVYPQFVNLLSRGGLGW